MDMLNLSHDQQLPLFSLPLLSGAAGGGGGAPPMPPPMPPAGGGGCKPAPLKTSSLSRLEELQAYLRHCDDQNYLKQYIKMLGSMPRDLLEELKAKLKARSAWLSGEEQREYKRAKLLNVMGVPCTAGTPGRGAGGPASCGDADFFCSQVLAGGSGGGGTPGPTCARAGGAGGERGVLAPAVAGGGCQLERLEMDLGQQHFMTPADATMARSMRNPTARGAQAAGSAVPMMGPPPTVQLGGDGKEAEDTSPPAAGVTDHQIAEISPDGQPAATGVRQQQQHGNGRSWQATLPGKAA